MAPWRKSANHGDTHEHGLARQGCQIANKGLANTL